MALVLAAQWWLVTTLRKDLRLESAQAALEVGNSLLLRIEQVRTFPSTHFAPALRMSSRPSSVPELELAYEAGATSRSSVPMQKLTPSVPVSPIRVPTARLEAIGDEFHTRMILGSLGILVLGLGAAAYLAKRVTAPLRDLASGALAIGEGRFGTEVPAVGERDLDATISSFNRMSRRLRELELAARDQQAREHLSEIGEIARGLAHGLRNPLHAIGLTFATIGSGDAKGARLDDTLAQGRAQVERIDRTLRLFLEMSTSSDGPCGEVDVVAVAQDVALECAQRVDSGVAIEVNAAKLRPQLFGIVAEVRAALQVLVVNAVEASSPGDRVIVGVESEAGAVRYVVEDSGRGVPGAMGAGLFEPHVTTKEQGAGFGLFLAQRIASRRYVGSLELSDREPRGTRAVLTLRGLERGDRE